MRRALALLVALAALALGAPAAPLAQEAAEAAGTTVVAARPLRPRTLLGAADLRLEPGSTPGALSDPAKAIGMETRGPIYRGAPVHAADLAPAAMVERNEIVIMTFSHGMLRITAEGRALGRGGEGELLQVMNLDSRQVVTAVVTAPGRVTVW